MDEMTCEIFAVMVHETPDVSQKEQLYYCSPSKLKLNRGYLLFVSLGFCGGSRLRCGGFKVEG